MVEQGAGISIGKVAVETRDQGSGRATAASGAKPVRAAHQEALLEQAIRIARGALDPAAALLRCTRDDRFWLVQESLAFAALLLSRTKTPEGCEDDANLALRIIDAVLQAQNHKLMSPDHGTFPMLWSPDRRHRSVPDPESREILGSLLATLLLDHPREMGAARCGAVREAIRRTVRPPQAPDGESTALRMLAAWLDLNFGDRFRGERSASELSDLGREARATGRVGNPRAYALELWALSLWQRSPRLSEPAESWVNELLDEAVSYVHPEMPDMFGAATTSTSAREDQFPWLGAWLTWHTLGPAPLLPKSFSDPLLATLYALPIAGNLQVPDACQAQTSAATQTPLALDMEEHRLTGWSEPAFLIEARESPGKRLPYTPVVGVRWQTSCGQNAWLRCLTGKAQRARCRERFVHLQDPGEITIEVFNLGPSGARMVEDGWWLSGLHFATDGFQLTNAERTNRCLTLTLRPCTEEPLLMFIPLT